MTFFWMHFDLVTKQDGCHKKVIKLLQFHSMEIFVMSYTNIFGPLGPSFTHVLKWIKILSSLVLFFIFSHASPGVISQIKITSLKKSMILN